MKVIIPVAGEGRRMRPHTYSKPKPLLQFAGKSCLQHILDELRVFNGQQQELVARKKKSSPISEIIFITGHLKEQIEEFVNAHYDFKCRYIEQKTKDGTAGAVKLAEPFIDEPVLIVYVDTVFEVDLGIVNNLREDESGIIWAKQVEDYRRFGVLVLDAQGYLSQMVEKPTEPISKLANIGMYYIKDYVKMFAGIKHIYDHDIMLGEEYYLTDAFVYMIRHGARIICPEVAGWYDTGKPETLLESNRELLKRQRHREVPTKNSVIIAPVYLADEVQISDSIIGPYVSIAAGTEITNSIIRDSVIGANTRIKDIMIEQSIIGDHVEIDDSPKQLNIGDYSVVGFGEKKKF